MQCITDNRLLDIIYDIMKCQTNYVTLQGQYKKLPVPTSYSSDTAWDGRLKT